MNEATNSLAEASYWKMVSMIPDLRGANHLRINLACGGGASLGGRCKRVVSRRQFLPALGARVRILLVSSALLFFLACRAGFADAAAAGPSGINQAIPVADALMIDDDGEHARLVFSVSQPVAAQAFVLANPNRLIIDLPEILFRIDPQPGKANSLRQTGAAHAGGKAQNLIGSFRFGLLARDRSRIVIDLNQPARLINATSGLDASGGAGQLAIELNKTDLASFLQSAEASRLNVLARDQAPGALPSNEPKPEAGQTGSPREARPVIVIDPGHGGIDSGAMAKGLVEKDLVFEFAKMLQRKLDALGRYKIVMTRDSDVFIPLQERVKIARESEAALFISIHADSLPDTNENVGGATVYTASDRASDAEAARVAESENQADAIAGLDNVEDASEVSGILFDLTRRETRTLSHIFARTLVNSWKEAARLNKNPQRSAGFRVLRAPDVPSVLLELGYLSNSKDGIAIDSPEWRDKATDKVTGAVENFFASYPALAAIQPPRPSSGEAPKEDLHLRELIGEEVASPGHLASELPPKAQ